MKATLILQNGSTFEGTSVGDTQERVCELVFNTAMAGYQEILTDPTYAGQGIVMSYPLIGNCGVNSEDNLSVSPRAAVVVVRHLAERGSNFRCEGSLDAYLKQYHITGISDVDTRAITRILRNQGTMNGMVTCAEHFSIEDKLAALRDYHVAGTVAQVTRTAAEVYPSTEQQVCRVALLDYGVTSDLLQALQARGCQVTAYPAGTPAATVLAGHFDGVLLSSGPGDPAEDPALVAQVQALYQSGTPLFAVGLGHQLLALATGARTEKLPHGHRGANYPVRDVGLGRVFITSQNHGYGVVAGSVNPAVATVSHVNVNDGTVEGLTYRNGKAASVQFQPEGNPSTINTAYLYDTFVKSMGGNCNA